MELDTKQRVLLALYTEYQKDLPEMRSIKPDVLELEPDVFHIAIMKLETEGYITDTTPIRTLGMRHPAYRIDSVKLTRDGIEYVESKLNIDPTSSGNEKARGVWRKVGEWGLEQFKDVIAKIAAEAIKGQFDTKS
jgi:hypothetical protein